MAKVDHDVATVRQLARALNANPFFKSLVVAAEFARGQVFGADGTTTLYALIQRFNGPTVPLELIAHEFFGLGRDKAYEYAAQNRLPVPTFRCTDSHKSPLLVHVEDLAALLAARRAAARSEWSKSQLAPELSARPRG
jgi:hypothetical protein